MDAQGKFTNSLLSNVVKREGYITIPASSLNWSCCDLQSSSESVPRLLREAGTSLIPFCFLNYLTLAGFHPKTVFPMQSLLLSGAENTMSAFLLNRLLVQNISPGQWDFFFFFSTSSVLFRTFSCEIDFIGHQIGKVT